MYVAQAAVHCQAAGPAVSANPLPVSPHSLTTFIQVVRYTALLFGISYGLLHQSTLQAKYDQAKVRTGDVSIERCRADDAILPHRFDTTHDCPAFVPHCLVHRSQPSELIHQ